jgi:biopolymer transport protein ExbD
MNAHGASESDDSGFGINVTPLVDITMVLLIIFMVTTRLSEASQLSMQLPRVAAADAPAIAGLEVQLTKDGARTLNTARVDDDAALLARVRQVLAADPNVHAVILADDEVRHGRVMRTLGLLKQAGVSKISFGVEDEALRRP